ncbi:sodium:proton antiporter [Reticulibacter mediterranei]|uniref:Sodium:proton antiporter n=1 Tax=Reticulibacter mediterranei TaxID=2778369 RepID=A0A8J3MZA7_9CHLR|nr:cation:proton antiporter [Reticulibacter mediterranei]GHO90248.1 sodium:proton antiporter [Reticulibacter mediterranei]
MSVPSFLALTACLLLVAKGAGWLCQRVRLPSVLGQLLVGVLIGPSFLHLVAPNELISSFANIGVIILMFLAGMETDMQQMRQVGVAAFVSASLGVIVPFLAGTFFSLALGYTLPVSLFLGTLLTATSVSISAQTLKDLGKLITKEGATILGAAVIDDVLGLIVLSVILAFTLGQNPTWGIVKMLLYFPIAYLLGHYGFPLLSRWLPRLLALEARIGLVLALVLLYAWSAESLGNVAAITGAYIAGILVSRTDMKAWVHDGLSKLGYAFFIPLFFVYVGIEANFNSIGQIAVLPLLAFIGVALITKVLGCGGGALLCRFRPHEALVVGVGMISRGEVALITATIGLQTKLIDTSLFSVVILITLVTTLVTPLLLKLTYLLPAHQSFDDPLSALSEQLLPGQEAVALQEENHVH